MSLRVVNPEFPPAPRSCVIYARYSTDRQDRMRCRDQVDACRAYAELQGWAVTGVYQDEALSGTLGREGRADWDRLLGDIETGRVPAGAVVLTFAWSRWSRDAFEGPIARMEVQRRGVDVADVRQGIFGRDIGGRLLVTIEEHRSSEFIAELRASVKSGLDARLREGYWTRSVAPYGYRMIRVPRGAGDAASLEPDPLEVGVVARIFRELDAGVAPTAVARGLNRDGVPTRRGAAWQAATVRGIATNPVYVGQVATYGGRASGCHNTRYLAARGLRTTYPGQHEPIVPVELWKRVSELWMPRPHQAPPRYRSHPLSGVVVCGACGRRCRVTGGAWPYRNYRCGSYSVAGCGNARLVRIAALEDAVRSWVRGLAEDDQAVDLAAREIALAARDESAAVAAARAPLEAELMELELRAAKYFAALEAGGAPALINQQLVKIEAAMGAVQTRLDRVGDRMPDPAPAQEVAAEIRAALAAGLEDLRAVAGMIDRIILPRNFSEPIRLEALGVAVPLEVARGPKARRPRLAAP